MISLLGACITLTPYIFQSTVFSRVDEANPNPKLGCIGRVIRDETDMAIASRDLPCFAQVILCTRKHRCAMATVLDRLGYRRRTDGNGYRTHIDLAPAVKRALHHSGYERISAWRVY